MKAIYQNIIFDVEKVEDLPAYHLMHNKKYWGTIYIDTNIISQMVVEGDTLEECIPMRHQLEGKFELLNYDIITPEWIKEIMKVKKLDVSSISEIAGVSESTMYRILGGAEISMPIKSSLFNFFNK